MLPVYETGNGGSGDTTENVAGLNTNSRRRRKVEKRTYGSGISKGIFLFLMAGLAVWSFGAIVFCAENVKTYGNDLVNTPYRKRIVSKDNEKLFPKIQNQEQTIQPQQVDHKPQKDDHKPQKVDNKPQKIEYKPQNDRKTQEIHQQQAFTIETPQLNKANSKPDQKVENTNTNTNTNTNNNLKMNEETRENEERRQAVLDAMKKSWGGYVKYAWGTDELRPVTKKGHDWLGMGATVIDSLDTLWIMGMKDEFNKARDWVRDDFNFRVDMNVSFFETTIRVLGGLLSAYSFSSDRVFLDKADELGGILMRACTQSPIGIPEGLINLATGATMPHKWTSKKAILADIGTVQLEFLYLSILTENKTYAQHALKIYDIIFEKNPKAEGLYHVLVDPRTGVCNGKMITIGALGDSFYEYLLKLWIFAGGPSTPEADKYRQHYDRAVDSIESKLIQRTSASNLTYISELKKGGGRKSAMDHLCCFAGGMFALGSHEYGGVTLPKRESHLRLGADVTRTCHEMYARSPSGLAPESVGFETNKDVEMSFKSKYDLIRPETVESFFYMWRKTHNKMYRDWGWEMFQAFRKHCETEAGFSGVKDVTKVPPEKDDLQPSWFLAETLKYFYLLFSPDDTISLDEYVFNTEAHPFPIQKQDIRKYFAYNN